MTKIIYDQNLLKYMQIFEQMTRARVRDCISEHLHDAKGEFDLLLFVVEPGEIAKAIGPRGANIHKLEALIKKRIKVVEWADEITAFIQNLIYPAKASNIEAQEKTIIVTPLDLQSRGMVIGRNAVNLRFYESVVRRYFECDQIKVTGG